MDFFSFSEEEDTARLTLRGPVCTDEPIDFFTKSTEAITPKGLDDALNKCAGKKKITVEINSQGGEIFSGIAICNRLKNLPAETEAVVMGVAASAASVIFCGCKVRKACKGSQILIHEAHTVISGCKKIDSAEARKLADTLEAINGSMAEIYADATGREKKECRALMAEETWISAERALELGFISEIIDRPADLSGDIRADIPLINHQTETAHNMSDQTKPNQTDKQPEVKADNTAANDTHADTAALEEQLSTANATIAAQKAEIDKLTAERAEAKKQQAKLAVDAAISAGKIAPQDTATIEAMTANYLANPEGTQRIINAMAPLPGFASAFPGKTEAKTETKAVTPTSPYDAVLAANEDEINARN